MIHDIITITFVLVLKTVFNDTEQSDQTNFLIGVNTGLQGNTTETP